MRGRQFWDLCVNDTRLESGTQKERVLAAFYLGFSGVAIVHAPGNLLSNNDRCNIKPISRENISGTSGLEDKYIAVSDGFVGENAGNFTQLTRVNVVIDDISVAQTCFSAANIINSYDLVAALPTSERAFGFACTSLDVDIISLDFSKRQMFRYKNEWLQAAIDKGKHFELRTAQLLRDPVSKRQFLANAQVLIRELRGRHLIISSHARSISDLRGPYDVANIGTVIGLTEKQALAAVSSNPEAVIMMARQRKAFRSAIYIRALNTSKDKELSIQNGDQ